MVPKVWDELLKPWQRWSRAAPLSVAVLGESFHPCRGHSVSPFLRVEGAVLTPIFILPAELARNSSSIWTPGTQGDWTQQCVETAGFGQIRTVPGHVKSSIEGRFPAREFKRFWDISSSLPGGCSARGTQTGLTVCHGLGFTSQGQTLVSCSYMEQGSKPPGGDALLGRCPAGQQLLGKVFVRPLLCVQGVGRAGPRGVLT